MPPENASAETSGPEAGATAAGAAKTGPGAAKTGPGAAKTGPGNAPTPPRRWVQPPPGRLIGKGHPAGDFLEAWGWDLRDEKPGYLLIEAELPVHVRNPRGQLFGGFTPTYVDLVALFTVRAGRREEWASMPATWLATTNMRIDYFEPITGPRFVMESRLEKKRGRTNFVTTRFLQDGELAVHAVTTLREVALDRSLGDA